LCGITGCACLVGAGARFETTEADFPENFLTDVRETFFADLGVAFGGADLTLIFSDLVFDLFAGFALVLLAIST
jgi:hypothetical protein